LMKSNVWGLYLWLISRLEANCSCTALQY